MILRTELSGRNKIEATNGLAVPVAHYSFGIIDWKISELKTIDTKTRKLRNMHKIYILKQMCKGCTSREMMEEGV